MSMNCDAHLCYGIAFYWDEMDSHNVLDIIIERYPLLETFNYGFCDEEQYIVCIKGSHFESSYGDVAELPVLSDIHCDNKEYSQLIDFCNKFGFDANSIGWKLVSYYGY